MVGILIHPRPIPSLPILGLHKCVVPHPLRSFSYFVSKNMGKVNGLGSQPCLYLQVEE